jgi:hypothetical protein
MLYSEDFRDESVMALEIVATMKMLSHFMRYVCVARTLARLVSCSPVIWIRVSFSIVSNVVGL